MQICQLFQIVVHSRQNCKSNQSDGKAENGNGAPNVAYNWQCHHVASSKLCRETMEKDFKELGPTHNILSK